MGLLGRYINALPEEVRDRVIRAQDWSKEEPGGITDLIAQAESGRRGWNGLMWRITAWRRRMSLGSDSRARLRGRFRRARKRIGTEHLIRLIKLRAGRPNRPPQDITFDRPRDLHPDGG